VFSFSKDHPKPWLEAQATLARFSASFYIIEHIRLTSAPFG
jgi:hypothetical protein